MGFVIEGFIGLGILLLLVWFVTYYLSVKSDQAEVKRRKAQEEKERAKAAEEARLYKPGEDLHCLGCNAAFTGPLPETGCPNCHTSSLVITRWEYLNTLKSMEQENNGK